MALSPDGMVSGVGRGYSLLSMFHLGYAIESLTLFFFFLSNVHIVLRQWFSLTNEKVSQTQNLTYSLSVLFNLINVWMEEEVFRGLSQKIMKGFLTARVYSL